jgi:hypothetical protein
MTETLKTVLDREASSVAFAPPDVDAITRAGRRRARRRRGAAALAAVVAVTLVGGGAVVLGGDDDGESVVASGEGPGGKGSSAVVSWAVGSTIHVGDDTIEAGHPIRAYVRTSVGFVVLDDADTVWSVTDDGITEIGRMTSPQPDNLDQQLLASDRDGSLAGWVGEDQSGDLIVETYDQATGESRSFPGPGARPPNDTVFFAIDDRTGYWRTPTGVVAVDLDSGLEREVVRITDDRVYDFEVYSVEGGVIAFTPLHDELILAGRSVEAARELLDFRNRPSDGMTDPVRLSPTGAWLSLGVAEVAGATEETFTIEKITPEVYDVVTGERVTLDHPAGSLAIPGVWLDDDTLQVLVFHGAIGPSLGVQDAALYACTVPSGSCEIATELGDVDLTSVVLPDGRYYPDAEDVGG